MKSMILRLHGLDPAVELERHERLAKELRAKRARIKSRNNSTTRDLISRAIYHEAEATAIKKEGIK